MGLAGILLGGRVMAVQHCFLLTLEGHGDLQCHW